MFNLDLAWGEVNKYLNLEIYGKKIVCPYFTNNIGKAFMDAMQEGGVDLEVSGEVMKHFNAHKYALAWWRGKGNPEEIATATMEIAKLERVNLEKASGGMIREFMLQHGLGVDCSGMVYNILSYAGINLDKILDFKNPERKGKFRAAAFTFAGRASQIIDFREVKSGDLILIINKSGHYSHVALILEKQGWQIVQSTAMRYSMGVFVDKLDISGKQPVFEFESELGTDWLVLWQEGRLEFRRLCCNFTQDY